jgi:hypothetical protein
MMTVREARPAVRVMSPVISVPVYLAHWIIEGNSHKNVGVSSRQETRKMLGRILKARLLIVGDMQQDSVDKHITSILTKEEFDCADFWVPVSRLTDNLSTCPPVVR